MIILIVLIGAGNKSLCEDIVEEGILEADHGASMEFSCQVWDLGFRGSSAVGVREMAWCRTLWWHQGNKTWVSHFLSRISQRAIIFEKIASNSWIFNDIHGVFSCKFNNASRVDHEIQSLIRFLSTGNGDSNRVWGLWEMCGLVCLIRDVSYPMTLKWDDSMIPWSFWKNDSVPTIFCWCGTWLPDRRWVKWATSSATSESCKLESFSGVMSSGRMKGAFPNVEQHVVTSISDARFHPFQQILGRECDEVWMPQRVGFLPDSCSRRTNCKSIAQSKCLRVWSFFDIYFCWDSKSYSKITNHSSCLKEKSCIIWAKSILQTKRL